MSNWFQNRAIQLISQAWSKVDTVEIADRTHVSIMMKMGETADATVQQIAAFIKTH